MKTGYERILMSWMKDAKKNADALKDYFPSEYEIREVYIHLKSNTTLIANLQDIFSTTNQTLIQQQRNALTFLSASEKLIVSAKLKTPVVGLHLYIIPAIFISKQFSRRTLDGKPNLNYPLTRFIIKTGKLFFTLITELLEERPLDNFKHCIEYPESKLSVIYKDLGVYLLNLLLLLDSNINLQATKWGYNIDLNKLYRIYSKPANNMLRFLLKLPLSLLPAINKPKSYNQTTPVYFENSGIHSHFEGKGITVARVHPSFFSLINLMQEEPHRVNKHVCEFLAPTLNLNLNNKFSKEINRALWPTLRRQVVIKKQFRLNKNSRWVIVKSKVLSKDKFYRYQRILPNLILISAFLFSHTKTPFYFRYFADPRGRIYTNVLFSEYEGDLSRSLLLPGESSMASCQIEYLRNCYLYGRRFFPKTKNFSVEQLYKFMAYNISTFLDELKTDTWIHNKSPYQYLAWLLEMRRLFDAKPKRNMPFPKNLLGFYDMSASGLQLLTLMTAADYTTDENYKATLKILKFLIDDPFTHEVQDPYAHLIEEFLKYYSSLQHPPHLKLFLTILQLLGELFRRKLAKNFIMKTLYSAGIYRGTKDLLDLLQKQKPEANTDLDIKIKEFYNHEYQDVFKTVRTFIVDFKKYLRTNKLKTVYYFIDKLSNLWARIVEFKLTRKERINLRKDIYLETYFNYKAFERKIVKVSLARGKTKYIRIVLYDIKSDEIINKPKIIRSFLAHLIHMIDSEILKGVVQLSNLDRTAERYSVTGVLHDCIAGNIGALTRFNSYFLSSFKLFFLGQTSENTKNDLKLYRLSEQTKIEMIDLQQLFQGFSGSYFDYLKIEPNLNDEQKADLVFLNFYFSGDYKKNLIKILDNLTGKAHIVM